MLGPEDLESLVRKCILGDGKSWSVLVERFQSLVYSIPRRMGLSEEDSSDVFQSTFLALFRNLDRIETTSTLPKWLTVTATREAYRLLNSKRSKSTVNSAEVDLDSVIAAEDQSVDEQLLMSETAEALRKNLDRLQTRCRILLTLLYLEDDVSYQEISERLSVPMGSIGPTRARCLDKLRSLLVNEPIFDEMYHQRIVVSLPN